MANDNKPDTSPLRAMALRFYNTVKGQWPASTPFGQLARVQSAGFMSILAGTNKDGEFLRKILLENGGTVDYVAAFSMRTGLIPSAGDLPEFYIIPQSGFVRCSIAPAGWRIIANTAGYRVETHAVPLGSKVGFDMMGRVEEVNFSTHKPPTKLDNLEGVLVELTHIDSGEVSTYWVDGDTIREKARDSMEQSRGRKNAWESHPIGMARSRALNMICKHHGPFAGISADPSRLGIRLDAASLTSAVAGQMDAAERARAAQGTQPAPATQSATPPAAQVAQVTQPAPQPAEAHATPDGSEDQGAQPSATEGTPAPQGEDQPTPEATATPTPSLAEQMATHNPQVWAGIVKMCDGDKEFAASIVGTMRRTQGLLPTSPIDDWRAASHEMKTHIAALRVAADLAATGAK